MSHHALGRVRSVTCLVPVVFHLLPSSPDVRCLSVCLAGAAGGLTALSKMPACNIMLVGAEKRSLSGFSQANVLPHTGFIYYSQIVQELPPVRRGFYHMWYLLSNCRRV